MTNSIFKIFDKSENKHVTEILEKSKSKHRAAHNAQVEPDVDQLAGELEQWLKKMRCVTSMRLEHFADIKVGPSDAPINWDDVTVLEPYPTLKGLKFEYKGGKDQNGKFKGKAFLEFENGDIVHGMFQDGMRQGECRTETNINGLRVLVGQYQDDKLSGKSKVKTRLLFTCDGRS